MNRRLLIIIAGIGMVVIVIIAIIVSLSSAAKKTTATSALIGGQSITQIILVNNQYVYAIEDTQLVRYEKAKQQAKQVLVDRVVAYSSSQQQQKIFVTVPVKAGQYLARVYDINSNATTDLKNTVGIVWFNNPLYLQIIPGPGLTQVKLVDSNNQAVISGTPIDGVDGFANRYVTYSLGEGSVPAKTTIYDYAQRKQVQEIQTANTLEPRMYGDYMFYKDGDNYKVINADLKTTTFKNSLALQNFSQNQDGQFVYTALFVSKDSKTQLQINQIDLNSGANSTLQTLEFDSFSAFSAASVIDSFWYDKSGVGYVAVKGSLFAIQPEAKQ